MLMFKGRGFVVECCVFGIWGKIRCSGAFVFFLHAFNRTHAKIARGEHLHNIASDVALLTHTL